MRWKCLEEETHPLRLNVQISAFDSCLDTGQQKYQLLYDVHFLYNYNQIINIEIQVSAYIIKVNYRLFLLDLYGVQYEDYEVNTVPHKFYSHKIKKMIVPIQVDVATFFLKKQKKL